MNELLFTQNKNHNILSFQSFSSLRDSLYIKIYTLKAFFSKKILLIPISDSNASCESKDELNKNRARYTNRILRFLLTNLYILTLKLNVVII
ncbi:hypothetical protein COF84_21215 [Bacillus wiedmannii]|nr:hypothetical protein COF84_21215 [Bacillus wiedmannii]